MSRLYYLRLKMSSVDFNVDGSKELADARGAAMEAHLDVAHSARDLVWQRPRPVLVLVVPVAAGLCLVVCQVRKKCTIV